MGILKRSGIPRGYLVVQMVSFGQIPVPDMRWITKNVRKVQSYQQLGDLQAPALDPAVGTRIVTELASRLELDDDQRTRFAAEALMRFRWAYAIALIDTDYLHADPPVARPEAQQAVHLRGMSTSADLPPEVCLMLPAVTNAGLFVGRGGPHAEDLVSRYAAAVSPREA